MTLYNFIRQTLVRNGGALSRKQLLNAIRSDPEASRELEERWTYSRVLRNLNQSGFIVIDGDLVRIQKRRSGPRRI